MKQKNRLACLALSASPALALAACAVGGPEEAATDRAALSAASEQGVGESAAGPITAPIVLCHFPPSDPLHPYTMWVPYWAVDDHLAHGDHLGPCRDGDGGCLPLGDECTYDHQCCTGSCFEGVCSSSTCLPAGDECTYDHQCCSGDCREGICEDGAGGCLSNGQACTYDHQCCSGSCYRGACRT